MTNALDKPRSSRHPYILDYFTDGELANYVKNRDEFDAHRPVTEFLDDIVANDYGMAYSAGHFFSSEAVVFGGEEGCKTTLVHGDIGIYALPEAEINQLFTFWTGRGLRWRGLVTTGGGQGLLFANRTVNRGLVLGGEHKCSGTHIDAVYSTGGMKEYGFLMHNNTTSSTVGNVRTKACGSGHKGKPNESHYNWGQTSRFGDNKERRIGGLNQSSTITVDTLPPADLLMNAKIIVEQTMYYVKSIDRVNHTITIFPALDRETKATMLRYVYGGGSCTYGEDASLNRIDKISSVHCSISYHSAALYPATVGSITSESNTINVMLGRSLGSAHKGGTIENLYCEAAEFDIVRQSIAKQNFVITNTTELKTDKLYDMTRTRHLKNNRLLDNAGFEGITIGHDGHVLRSEGTPHNGNEGTRVDVTDVNRTALRYQSSIRNEVTFSLAVPNSAINKNYGYNRKEVITMGSGVEGAGIETVNFQSENGLTVNGQATYTFDGLLETGKFDCFFDFAKQNFIVNCWSRRKSNDALLTQFDVKPSKPIKT